MQTTFLKLKQGDKSVEEYYLGLNRLTRFFLEYVSNDKMKIDHFVAGLWTKIQGLVVIQTSSDYAKALGITTLMDMP